MSTIIPNVTIRAAKVTVFSSMPQMKNIPKDMKIVIGIVDAATEALEHDDYSSFINYNQSFHYEIWRAAGNEKMEHMLAELWNGLSLGVQSTVEKYAKRSNEEHRAIYEAMEKRDAEASRKEMRYHIYRSMEDMLTRYE